MDCDEEDPVVAEVDVYHTQALADHLCLLQYPLRPAHLPYESVVGAKVSLKEGVSLDINVRPRGENYSASRGEGFAKMVQMGAKGQEKVYESGLWDKLTLTSDQPTEKLSRYVAAVFKDGDLHLTTVRQILQLKPSLTYLDQVESGAKVSRGAGTGSDGDTTESEGEEAIPVTVRFSRQATKGQSAHPRKKSFTEIKMCEWVDVRYNGVESEEATEERALLFASEDASVNFDLARSEYLNLVCPIDTPLSTVEPITMPTGMLSLSQLKTLPLEQQVLKVLLNAHVVQFGQLCSLLGVTGQIGGVLKAVQGCGVLVQGCWVVKGELLYPDDPGKRNARDYILWCFSQRRLVPRKEIAGVIKLPQEEVREMLRPLGNVRVNPQNGWEFTLNTDIDFLNKHVVVAHDQEDKWIQRHKELVKELAIKSSVTAKHAEGKVVTGEALVKSAHKLSQERVAAVKTEAVEGVSEELVRAVREFCAESVGRGVLGLTELKDKLLLKQSSVRPDHPLRVCGVSDAILLDGVKGCGAVEVCGGGGRPLYALTHGDKVRAVILSLFQTHKAIKKKQVMECLSEEGVGVSEKVLASTLRELCYSKGSQWKLLGMD